jgi:uncharacterized membrane protein HdeD (DUF308 family)
MRKALSSSWWWLVVRGLAAVAFGILAIAWPGATLLLPGAGALALVWMISVCAIATGILFIILGFRLRASRHDALHPREARAA